MPYFFTLILVQAGVEDMKTLLIVNIGLCVWASISNLIGVFLLTKFGRKTILSECYSRRVARMISDIFALSRSGYNSNFDNLLRDSRNPSPFQ